jgi:hypothetical protein
VKFASIRFSKHLLSEILSFRLCARSWGQKKKIHLQGAMHSFMGVRGLSGCPECKEEMGGGSLGICWKYGIPLSLPGVAGSRGFPEKVTQNWGGKRIQAETD